MNGYVSFIPFDSLFSGIYAILMLGFVWPKLAHAFDDRYLDNFQGQYATSYYRLPGTAKCFPA